jgi:hypothetical protein
MNCSFGGGRSRSGGGVGRRAACEAAGAEAAVSALFLVPAPRPSSVSQRHRQRSVRGGQDREASEHKMLKYEDSRYACLFEYLTPITRFLGVFTSVGECKIC